MTTTHIAVCRECGSTNVYPIGARPAGLYAYFYVCRACDHTTPERPTLKAAAADVDWRPVARTPVQENLP